MQEPAPFPLLTRMQAETASLVFALFALFVVLHFGLVPAVLAGLITFNIIYLLARIPAGGLHSTWGKLLVVGAISLLVLGLIVGLWLLVGGVFRSEAGLSVLFEKMAQIIEQASDSLPTWVTASLPNSAEDIRAWFVHWLRTHSVEMQRAGRETGALMMHLMWGVILGIMVAFREVIEENSRRPLAQALLDRAARFNAAFRNVVFAQVKISALNTLFTALYLALVLPGLGVHLPFTKTMIVLTFLLGLLPVLGNLMSNVVIITVSFSHSLQAALGSFAFLVIIHKFEYVLNARIIGARINAQAWELMVAMLAAEAVFGLPGVAAAPIVYAYLKAELEARQLV